MNVDDVTDIDHEIFLQSKSFDQGSFGSQVENFLRQQHAKKDRQINSLLKIIENGGLGNCKVIDFIAAVVFYVTGSVTYQRPIVQTIALR